MRLFINLFLAMMLTALSIVTSANALEVQNNCCLERISNSQAAIQNDCTCCSVPNNKTPSKTAQIQLKLTNTDLQPSVLRVETHKTERIISIAVDKRRPLHLASNQLYIQKRALLI